LLSKQVECKIKLLGELIEDQSYNSLMVLISEKDAIIFYFAIKIIKDGKSHDEVAKITKLLSETVENCVENLSREIMAT
jgi:hypothetical protein